MGGSYEIINNMDSQAVEQVNALRMFLSFKQTWVFRQFIRLPHKFICMFTGNQFGKSNGAMYSYVLRCLGLHPIPERNVLYFKCDSCGRTFRDTILRGLITGVKERANLRPEDNRCPCGGRLYIPERNTRTIRLAAEVLPGQSGSDNEAGAVAEGEVKNTLYPALRKWLPPFLVKKDITFRNPAMHVLDVNFGHHFGDLIYEDPRDIVMEFVSYKQSIQSGAGVQRMSVYCDEEPPVEFFDEQVPRLLAEDGDFCIGLTPANRMTWTYDQLYERAALFVRTQTICDYLNSREDISRDGKAYERLEATDSGHSIAVIQAATDDNPTLSTEAIETLYDAMESDTVDIRRYGIHKQVQGRIFKGFDRNIHVIDPRIWFDEDDGFMPPDDGTWMHARMIDYHEENPWACLFAAMSPRNEMFVYWELSASPAMMTNESIAEKLAHMSGDRRYALNLIDPLANKRQTNTGKTTVQDLNRVFSELRKEGIGTGAYWETWDTKSTFGRDAVKLRLKNARLCERPWNNLREEGGKDKYLPTIWFLKGFVPTCIGHVQRWRLQENLGGATAIYKDANEAPAQKDSHFCMCLEGVLKDRRFRARPAKANSRPKAASYFQRRN